MGMKASGQVLWYCFAASWSTGANAVEPDRVSVPVAQSSGAAVASCLVNVRMDWTALTMTRRASTHLTGFEANG